MEVTETVKFTGDRLKKFFPPRKSETHKGDYGKVAIIGGSAEYVGAPLLCSMGLAAARTGCGLNRLCVPKSMLAAFAERVVDSTLMALSDDCNGKVKFDLDEEARICAENDVIVIGSGMGINFEAYKIIKFFLREFVGTLVIDADGLNNVAKFGTDILKYKNCRVALTPHPGEFSRLTGAEVGEIRQRRAEAAKRFAEEYGVCVALKDDKTVITSGGTVFENTAGTPALSKGGSGDVLAGICGAMLCGNRFRADGVSYGDGDAISEAVAGACYLLGKAGELAAAEIGENSLLASDTAKYVGKALFAEIGR